MSYEDKQVEASRVCSRGGQAQTCVRSWKGRGQNWKSSDVEVEVVEDRHENPVSLKGP